MAIFLFAALTHHSRNLFSSAPKAQARYPTIPHRSNFVSFRSATPGDHPAITLAITWRRAAGDFAMLLMAALV